MSSLGDLWKQVVAEAGVWCERKARHGPHREGCPDRRGSTMLGLSAALLKFNVCFHYLGILLKCRLWYSRPRMELCVLARIYKRIIS